MTMRFAVATPTKPNIPPRVHTILLILVMAFSSLNVYGEPTQIDIRKFIDEYAKQESVDIVIDPRLRGVVSLSSELTPGHISDEEFYSALLTHNFGAVKIEGTMRIVQNAAMKQHKLPFFDGKNRNGLASSQIVNSIIKLREHSAEKLAPKMRALIPVWGYITADTQSNSLVLVSTVDSVEQLVELIDKLNE